jgi:hypothetical protein
MAHSFEIKELADDLTLWDRLVEASPQGTVFHKLAWLKTIEKHTNTKLTLIVSQDKEEIFAAIPFFYRKMRHILKRLFSPPYNMLIPYLGPIFPNSDKWKQSRWESRSVGFLRELDDYIRSKIGADCIFVSTNMQDIRGFLWTGYSASLNYTYIGDISDKSLIWQRFSASVRRGIKNAEKEGVEIIESDKDGYRFVTDSFLQDLIKDGVGLNISTDYFLDLYEGLPENFKVFVSTYKEKTIGGLVATVYKDTASFWLGGVRANLKGIYPNYFLLWKTIEWASDQGFRYFDLFGADVPHISSFKSGLNFNLMPFYDLRKSTTKYKIFVNNLTKHIIGV